MIVTFTVALSALRNRRWHVPWLLELRSSSIFVTTVCSVAIFTDIFVYGVVSCFPRADVESFLRRISFTIGGTSIAIHVDFTGERPARKR